MTNPKCLGGNVPDTFSARSAHLTGLKMRRITRVELQHQRLEQRSPSATVVSNTSKPVSACCSSSSAPACRVVFWGTAMPRNRLLYHPVYVHRFASAMLREARRLEMLNEDIKLEREQMREEMRQDKGRASSPAMD